MIARQRALAGRHERAAEVAELLGVHLDREPERARRREQPLGLRDAEGDVLAEYVHGIDEALRAQLRQPLARDGLDVLIGAAAVFRRQRMGGEERRAHRDRKRPSQVARDAQHLRFIRQRQAVAGFDLHRGDALGEQRRQPWRALIEQLFLARRTHRTHGGEDAAAGARDLLVRAPAQPLGVLVGARAGEHQVRMTVDQPGCDPGARQIMYLIRRRRQRRFLPHPLDAPGAGRERTARDDARRGVAGRELRVAPQLERFGHALLPLSLAGTAG